MILSTMKENNIILVRELMYKLVENILNILKINLIY